MLHVEFELWQLITLGATILGAFWGMAKMLMSQNAKAIDVAFDEIRKTLSNHGETGRRTERELLDLKVELAKDYVRREDHLKDMASIAINIDRLMLRFDKHFAQLRGGSGD